MQFLLPPEILTHIASYASIQEKVSLGKTCSVFRDITAKEINLFKKSLPWKISIEVSISDFKIIYETRVKIGWFDSDSPQIYKEDWVLQNSKLIVFEGIGGEICNQILDQYPTLKIKLKQIFKNPPVFEILSNDAKQEIGYAYDYADVEIGSLTPVEEILIDSRMQREPFLQLKMEKYNYSLYFKPKNRKRKKSFD
jgi:hypothetical protein